MRGVILILCAGLATASWGERVPPKEDSPAAPAPDSAMPPMDMNAPMDNAMKKPGMKKGDVRAAEQRHRARMKAELEREQGTMPPAGRDEAHAPRE